MEAVPFYPENGYDALDPAGGALRQMPAHGAVYHMKAGETPLSGERQIPEVALPENPFGVDVRIVKAG
jgi:hypothetical protein